MLNFYNKSSIRHSMNGVGEAERRQKNRGYRKPGFKHLDLFAIIRVPSER